MSEPKTKFPRAELEKVLNLKKNRETVIKVFGVDPGWPHPVPLDIAVKRTDDGDYVFDNPVLTKVHPHAQARDTVHRANEKAEFAKLDEETAPVPPPPPTKSEPEVPPSGKPDDKPETEVPPPPPTGSSDDE